LAFDQLSDLPHHRGQVPHDLIIPKADNPQPHLSQHLLPPFIFFFLQIVDIAINLHNQACLMTIKVNNESLNNLLPPKVDSQLIRPPKVPEGGSSSHTLRSFLGGSRFATEFFPGTVRQDRCGALEINNRQVL
jgi:hypothetical protein